jgi:aldose 1-epimerase
MRWCAGTKYAIVALLACCPIFANAKTEVTKQPFGHTKDGTSVEIYTLKNNRMEARIMTYGGIIVSLKTPDRHGKLEDVVLGYDSLDKYIANNPGFGALIGRYANRIAHATFELDGHKYSLPKINNGNSLHGGTRGFDKVVWKARQIANGIELTHVSLDGDQGFPGTLTAIVQYTLEKNALKIDYSATTDKDTVVNLTNHSYFNLIGGAPRDILAHELKLNASRVTPVDAALIPIGGLKSVKATPFDFRHSTIIGKNIDAKDEQLINGKGYDHNWVLDGKEGSLKQAAIVSDPMSGRVMEVLTTEPGVQFYSGNFLDGSITGKEGRVYQKHWGLCLETQHYPDSPNHPEFPSTELKPKQRYHTVTIFRFSAR